MCSFNVHAHTVQAPTSCQKRPIPDEFLCDSRMNQGLNLGASGEERMSKEARKKDEREGEKGEEGGMEEEKEGGSGA